jgi:hypothetical protein
MSNRPAKRNNTRILNKVISNGKKDMQSYIESTGEITIEQLNAWKAGYVAGINRANSSK